MTSICVLRPYRKRIRERVFALLGEAGFDMAGATVVAAGATDSAVVAALSNVRPDALLVPFHAHRDTAGSLVNGLELLPKLMQAWAHLHGLPIYMPISAMGLGSAGLMLSRGENAGGLSDALRQRVLFMPEGELAAPTMRDRVLAHAAFVASVN